jgi:hypothetical protein
MSTAFNPFARHMVESSDQAATAVDSKPVERSSNESRPKPRARNSPPMLIYWLQNSWPRPIISLREIITYGPWGIRDRKSALAQAELLEQAGWLVPIETPRRDRRDRRTRVWRSPITTIKRSELQRLNEPDISKIGGLGDSAG